MIRVALTASAAVLATQGAFAGGIERSSQSIAAIFEQGKYIEFSFASVNPKISGVGAGAAVTAATPTPGIGSGNMALSYATYGVALKMPINDKIDAALIIDQPFGADLSYPLTGYYMSGSTASLQTMAYTGVLRYRFTDRISAIVGLRAQTLSAVISLPPTLIPPSGYTASGTQNLAFGFLVGAAYERPEIALRVALTYNSAIEHDLGTTEDIGFGPTATTTTIKTPRSVNLEFQTGVAADTLAFGSIRWVEWSKFAIAPPVYTGAVGSPIVSFSNDTITYTLGVGRRVNENWSFAAAVAYEAQSGGFSSNLSPTDGRTSATLAATYTQDNMKITAGISHIWIGDAMTEVGGSGIAAGTFASNTATAFGMKIGFNF